MSRDGLPMQQRAKVALSIQEERDEFARGGLLPGVPDLQKASVNYLQVEGRARMEYRRAVRETAGALMHRKLVDAATKLLQELDHECPFCPTPSAFQRQLADLSAKVTAQVTKGRANQGAVDTRDTLRTLLEECAQNRVTVADLHVRAHRLTACIRDCEPFLKPGARHHGLMVEVLQKLNQTLTEG